MNEALSEAKDLGGKTKMECPKGEACLKNAVGCSESVNGGRDTTTSSPRWRGVGLDTV